MSKLRTDEFIAALLAAKPSDDTPLSKDDALAELAKAEHDYIYKAFSTVASRKSAFSDYRKAVRQVATLTGVNAATGDQTTTYHYGTKPSGVVCESGV